MHDKSHLQTVMFLQLVAGGITRTECWYFRLPFPATLLLGAISAAQVLATATENPNPIE